MKKTFLLSMFILLLIAGIAFAETPDELFENAEALFAEESFEQALDAYNGLYLNYPDYEEADTAMFKAGMTEMRLEMFDQAVETFSKLIQKYPETDHKLNAMKNIEIIEDYIKKKDQFTEELLEKTLQETGVDIEQPEQTGLKAPTFEIIESVEEKTSTGYIVLTAVSVIALVILAFLIIQYEMIKRKRKHRKHRKH